jgi:branched-chain amino acid aminotransferase
MLDLPYTKEEISKATCDTVAASGLNDGYIRLVVTRGIGNLGLSPFNCSASSTYIIADKIALYDPAVYENGLSLVTSSYRRNRPDMICPQVKSLNYLNNILAKVEAIKHGAAEALMLNDQGNVAECTGDNIFIVKNGKVITPPVTDGALDGITRQVVLEICRELGIPSEERTINRYTITIADECFLTGTAAECVPVTGLDSYTIGSGKIGPVTARLLARFKELTATTGRAVD